MPREVFDREEFMKLAEGAAEVRVVRRGDKVKLKARRKRYLYTYVTDVKEAEEILEEIKERLRISIVEY